MRDNPLPLSLVGAILQLVHSQIGALLRQIAICEKKRTMKPYQTASSAVWGVGYSGLDPIEGTAINRNSST